MRWWFAVVNVPVDGGNTISGCGFANVLFGNQIGSAVNPS